jgi:hypothetical protein
MIIGILGRGFDSLEALEPALAICVQRDELPEIDDPGFNPDIG